MRKYEYTNRDISWLSFNFRVLQEAMDKTLPLYERLKFLAIYSNNTEEFYQVRVSYYKHMLRHEKEFPKQHFNEVDPASILRHINEIVTNQQSIFHLIFEDEILPATHTTPDPIALNRLLAEMVECGCEFAFVEASSHAIHQR